MMKGGILKEVPYPSREFPWASVICDLCEQFTFIDNRWALGAIC